MLIRDSIKNEYFEWLFELVCGERYSDHISYRKLLMFLHSTDFRYSILRDENRAYDGLSLRRRFILSKNYDESFEDYIDDPCSVLEMMISLAIRCEENIMDDPGVGDRTGQWFWGMINNLGLGGMYDNVYNKIFVIGVVNRFLDREYEPNGKGGLFYIRNCDQDLRDVEIWYQLCWYLDSII